MTSHAILLVQHVQKSRLQFTQREIGTQTHIGATLVDTVLQAGLNYQTVVRPRASRIRYHYPEAGTLKGFHGVIECLGAHEVLRWRHPEKPQRLVHLVDFLLIESIDTEHDLIAWLREPRNEQRLQSIRGIGPKSVDYLKLLLGMDAIAVDRHLRRFAHDAGIREHNYFNIRGAIEAAATSLKVDYATLDVAIWDHMSAQRTSSHGVLLS